MGNTLKGYPTGNTTGSTLKGYPTRNTTGSTLKGYPTHNTRGSTLKGYPTGNTPKGYPTRNTAGNTPKGYPTGFGHGPGKYGGEPKRATRRNTLRQDGLAIKASDEQKYVEARQMGA